jgi:hypothetical protein
MSSLEKKCVVCGLRFDDMKAKFFGGGNIVCVRGDEKEECLKVYLDNPRVFRDMPTPPIFLTGLANMRFGITEERVVSF